MVTIGRIAGIGRIGGMPELAARGFAVVQGRRHRRLGVPPLGLLLPALAVGAAMLLPLLYLIIRSAGASETAWELLFRWRTLETLWRTALLMVCATALSVAIAVPFAWLTARSDLPLRRAWAVLAALPLVIPSFVGAFLYISALGPRGLLQSALEPLFGAQRLPEIYGLPGATLALGLLSYPYVFLTVRGAIARLDPAMDEAARGLGHGPWSAFFRVALPQLRPSIAAGGLLVALYALNDFGAVSLMRYETFTFAIYQQYGSAIDLSIPVVLSLALAVFAAGVLLMERRTRGRQRYYRSGAGSARPPKIIRLGAWKWPVFGMFAGVLGLALALPVGALAFWLLRGLGAGEPLLPLWAAARNSLLASGAAAAVTVAMAAAMAALLVRHPTKLNRVLEPASYTGYALPGVVVALALVSFGAHYARPLYQTLWLMIFAYAALFFPVALGAVRASFLQVSPRLEDAARGLGHSPISVALRVVAPLIGPGVLTGAALVFLLTMKELPATLILGPFGFKTLAVEVWSASSEAFFARAAAPALLIILMSSVPLTLLALRERRLDDG